MTRGVMRAILRRHLHDDPGAEWSDAELNDILNISYSLVQKEIRKVFPEAHLTWDYIDSVTGTSWYPLPATFGIVRVGLKSLASTSDTDYVKLLPKRYEDIGPDLVVWSGGVVVTQNPNILTNYYTKRGQWIGIFPAPTVSISGGVGKSGIQLVHVAIMSMSDDDEVPKIKVPLHMAIVYWAHILAAGELDASAAESRQRLQEILGDLAGWYDESSDEPDKLQVGM